MFIWRKHRDQLYYPSNYVSLFSQFSLLSKICLFHRKTFSPQISVVTVSLSFLFLKNSLLYITHQSEMILNPKSHCQTVEIMI